MKAPDARSEILVSIDEAACDFFTGKIPASEFLSDNGTDGLGIGNDEYETISYEDFRIARK